MSLRSKTGPNILILAIAILMIGYGGYMSYVDLNYVPQVSDEVVAPISVDDTREPIIRLEPIKPLPSYPIGTGNIFGGDGTINLANIILFAGIVLFFFVMMLGRR